MTSSLMVVRPWLEKPLAVRLGVLGLFLALWEVSARTVVDPGLLSPPTRVSLAFPEIFSDAKLVDAIVVTFWELLLAYLMSIGAGVAIGLWIGLHRFSYRSVLPLVLLVYSIPQVVVLPLFVMYFGIGPASKIAFGVSHGVFPVIFNVVAGVQHLSQPLVLSAYSMGASRLQILRRVSIPQMIPSFFAGLRLAMSATLLGVLLAELYVSIGGVGYYAKLFSQSFDPARMFALVTVLAAMAIFLNELARRAEIRFSRWKV